MDRSHAERMTAALALAEAEGRWTPRQETRAAMNGLEQALCRRIQSGQPALEDMNRRLLSSYGDTVLSQVCEDWRACRIASPSLDDIRLFSSIPQNVVAHDFTQGRPAIARAA